ncbi:NAD(P)/FAD-dependent oxidoreductase [Sphingomonas elodea]|uniref:NAD(P)/FAD-dependent oxidoreductase n=1 Tax=Sphingomonas elodea TaxID=179878 RepID=UPI00026306DD|nr:FAD-dependent oxidoreductase [Sphingomonas elodea]
MQRNMVVIGGGVVGLASALALARAGWRVRLIDTDTRRQAASWGNAGHIAIEQVEPLASWATVRSLPRRRFGAGGAVSLPAAAWRHWLPFGLRLLGAARPRSFAQGRHALSGLLGAAMPAWQRLAASLDTPDLLRDCGHIVSWGSADRAETGRRAWASADIGTARFRDATPAERLHLPGGCHAGAIRFTNTAQIADLAALDRALRNALGAAGGAILTGHATLARAGAEARVAVDGVALADVDAILVTAGVASGRLLAPLGHRVPIIAERGYHIRATDHDWPADLPPLVFEDPSMIVTRYAGCVQAASFVEFAGIDTPPDPAKWERLEAHVADLGLPLRPPFTRWMGARPTLPDYLPAIGRSARAGNVLYAFGHQHLGLTLAAVTADCVAALADGRRAAIDLTPFGLHRFEA